MADHDLIQLDSISEGDWPDGPVEVTDSNFKSMVERFDTAVVDCWAPWCGPCRMLGPIINDLAKKHSGSVVFGKLNTDHNRQTAMEYQIMGIPTLLFFKGGELKDKIVGMVPAAAIEQKIKAL